MKRVTALALVFALVGLGLPATPFAQAPQAAGGQLAGAARHENGQPAANYSVRLRNAGTGQLVGTATTGPAGEFSFSGLGQGTYVVEVLDNSGRIVATSTSINLGTGAMNLTGVAITLTEGDKLAGAVVGGGNFFTSTTGIIVMAAAGAAAVGGVAIYKDKDKDKKPKSPSK